MGKIEQQIIQEMSVEALAWGSEAHRHASRSAFKAGNKPLGERHFNRAVNLLMVANEKANEYESVMTEVNSILKK